MYRARDSKLGRDVAINVLPHEVIADPEQLARFRREAQVLASLNHPANRRDLRVEEAEGRPFLVMELVEGENLSWRLARGPIPLDDAIFRDPYARRLAGDRGVEKVRSLPRARSLVWPMIVRPR